MDFFNYQKLMEEKGLESVLTRFKSLQKMSIFLERYDQKFRDPYHQ